VEARLDLFGDSANLEQDGCTVCMECTICLETNLDTPIELQDDVCHMVSLKGPRMRLEGGVNRRF